jgi:TolB protein
MKKNALLRSFLAVVMGSTMCFAEKVSLESYAHNLDSIAIGILPFKSLNGKPVIGDEPWKVIANDLEFSGRFAVTNMTTRDTNLLVQKNIPIFIDGSFSADGSFIVMDLSLNDSKTGDILVEKKYSGENKNSRRMAHGFSNELVEMLFSDKGIFTSKICYVKDDGPAKNIMVMDYDGKNQRVFTSNTSINIFPVFADSTSILWTCFLRGQPDIFKGSIGTQKSQPLIKGRFVETSPSVSSVDGKIVFASSREGNMEIYSCDAEGNDIKRLTFSKSINTSPCWSPNGYQIAFTSDRAGSPQIYVMDADGTNCKRLTYEGGYQDSPAWSPKGDKIAYQSISGGAFDIWTIQSDGTNAVKVTTNPGSNEYPAWSADGMHIVFSCKNGFKTDLYAVKADGSHLKRLTTTGNAKMPEWSIF